MAAPHTDAVFESVLSSRIEQPWAGSAQDVIQSLDSDPATGLGADDVTRRRAVFGPNMLHTRPPEPGWRRFLRQFTDPLVILLIVAAAIALVAWIVEHDEALPFDAIVIALIVLANAVLGHVQQARAAQAVAALRQMAAPTAQVIRDGVVMAIPASDVVPGDVLTLAEGDAIVADARLIEGASLMVSEASLTGESEPVAKDPAPVDGAAPVAERQSMVFSGTGVTRGRGRAVVTSTGMRTEMGHIATLLDRTEDVTTPLQREVGRVGRMLGVAVIAITMVVVAAIMLTGTPDTVGEFVAVLLIGVSLAVAAVPEGLPAILSIVLALGVQRMAKRNAIVKSLPSVETLGSASTVCTDKTGTLTKNEMTIQRIVTASGTVAVSGTGYEPSGELIVDASSATPDVLRDEAVAVLRAGALSNDATMRLVDGMATVTGDPTEIAFLVAEAKTDADRTGPPQTFARIGEIPFTSERKLMSTVQHDPATGDRLLVTKGAPDVLLALCTAEQVAGRTRPLTAERRAQIAQQVDGLGDLALRTLAVAHRPLADDEDLDERPEAERDLIHLGVVGIIDPPRTEALHAIADAHTAGIRVVMITGDHPRTAVRIATELGITDDPSAVLTGTDLDAMDDDARTAAIVRTNVFARVAPEHKLRIIDALHADGQIVAMTGDGVNDAPALKAADIGVAMGRTGTQVAQESSDVILADDNFATIISAVREGRAIFANIRTFLRFLLSSNIGEVFTMFFGVVLAGLIGLSASGDSIAVPLLATQILWINLLTDTAPALALGVDPPMGDLMRRAPRALHARVIDRAMWAGILIVGATMALATLFALDLSLPGGLVDGSNSVDHARTMAFTTLVFAQLFNCFNARSDHRSAFHRPFSNPLLWGAIVLSTVLQVAVVVTPFLNDAFSTTPLGLADWLWCIALASAVLWVDELRKVLVRRRASVVRDS